MIERFTIGNLEEDTVVYQDAICNGGSTKYHLYDDCQKIKSPDEVNAKNTEQLWDSRGICKICAERYMITVTIKDSHHFDERYFTKVNGRIMRIEKDE